MSLQDAKDRVVIFIDGSNLYHALDQNCGRMDLDFTKFAETLTGDRRMVRIYYYNVLQDAARNPEGSREQQKFLTGLYNTPYLEVRLGSTRQREGVTVEKGVDVMLAVDLVSYGASHLYDVAIVVSGDADYAYAVQTVKNMGRQVELAAFESNASQELLLLVDNRHFLDRSFFRDLWIGQHAGGAAAHRLPPRTEARPAPRQDTRTSPLRAEARPAPRHETPEHTAEPDRTRGRRRRRPFRREPAVPGTPAAEVPGVEPVIEPPAKLDMRPPDIEPIEVEDEPIRDEREDMDTRD